MLICDCSSDVCSSDLELARGAGREIDIDSVQSGRSRVSDRRSGCAQAAGREILYLNIVVLVIKSIDIEYQRAVEQFGLHADFEIIALLRVKRSDERRLGNEGDSTCRFRWSTYN